MAKEYVQEVTTPRKPDELIFSLAPQAQALGVTLSAGQGLLKRGAALTLEDSGEYVLLGSGVGKANAILCDDTDTDDGATYTAAYRAGHFNRVAVEEATGTAVGNEDKENLRSVGILLSDAH